MNNIFTITDENKLIGNGFIIRNGYALTCSHVLRDGGAYAFMNSQHIKFDLVMDFRDEINDITNERNLKELYDYALIRCEEFKLSEAIEFRKTELTRGEVMRLVAYSENSSSIVMSEGSSTCLPHAPFRNTESIDLNTSTNQPQYGNSGCPVFDGKGSIIGLFYGMSKDANRIYAIKIAHIFNKIEELSLL